MRSRGTATAASRSRLPTLAAQEHLERQQRPQRVAVVAHTAVVLGEDAIDGRGIEMLLDPRVARSERRADVATQVLAKPAVQRHAEAALGTVEDLIRHQVTDRGLEHALELDAAQLQA